VSCALKIEETRSSEKLVNRYQNAWRHIPEDCTFHNHRSEKLESQNVDTCDPNCTPSSGTDVNSSKKPVKADGNVSCLLLLVSSQAYSSTLKLEVACSYRTSGSRQTTQHYSTESHSLHKVYCLRILTYVESCRKATWARIRLWKANKILETTLNIY
jgi:hypothetical protein